MTLLGAAPFAAVVAALGVLGLIERRGALGPGWRVPCSYWLARRRWRCCGCPVCSTGWPRGRCRHRRWRCCGAGCSWRARRPLFVAGPLADGGARAGGRPADPAQPGQPGPHQPPGGPLACDRRRPPGLRLAGQERDWPPAPQLGAVGWALGAFVLYSAVSLFWSSGPEQGAYNFVAFYAPFGALAAMIGWIDVAAGCRRRWAHPGGARPCCSRSWRWSSLPPTRSSGTRT